MNAIDILERVKLFLNAKSDTDLSQKLGKFQNYIYQLKKRNNIDIDIIIEHCPDADFNWILTGRTDKPCRIAELDSKGNRREIDIHSGDTNTSTESNVNEIDITNLIKQLQEKDSVIQQMSSNMLQISSNMLQLQQLLAEHMLKEKKE